MFSLMISSQFSIKKTNLKLFCNHLIRNSTFSIHCKTKNTVDNLICGEVKSLPSLFRWTPLIPSQPLSDITKKNIHLKLDVLQPSNSFKSRGIGYMCEKAAKAGAKHFITSSGGNAGLATAYASQLLGILCTVYVPSTTPKYMLEKLRAKNAQVKIAGNVWDAANAIALNATKDLKGAVYIPPFDHPDIWEGHSSVIHELYEDLSNPPDVILVAVGGGGYLAGVCQGLQRVGWENHTHVIAMETIGAHSLNASYEAGKIVVLDDITSIARSLGAKRVCNQAFECTKSPLVFPATVSDDQAIETCRRFADDHNLLVEPACGAALAPLYTNSIQKILGSTKYDQVKNICVLVCGGNMHQEVFKKNH